MDLIIPYSCLLRHQGEVVFKKIRRIRRSSLAGVCSGWRNCITGLELRHFKSLSQAKSPSLFLGVWTRMHLSATSVAPCEKPCFLPK